MVRQSLVRVGSALVVAAMTVALAGAQAPSGRLVVSVVDQMGAVIPNAAVTVRAQDSAEKALPRTPATTDAAGVAAVAGLAEGRYTIEAAFPGFQTAILQDVRVRSGVTRRRITLQIAKHDEAVTVSRDGRSSALDPVGSAFSSVLTREQIESLPDDPDEMEQVLKAMAPPGAVIRVDGFTGGRLPPKSQIRSIRLPRMDMFAAQNHGGMNGMLFIDIMTMPGNGPLRGNADFNFMDDALNARNAFTPVKGAEQLRQYGYSLSGTLKENRTSFSINGGGGSRYASPNLLAVLPDGTTTAATLRQPRDTLNVAARVDQTLTKDHALRASFDRTTSDARDLGVGGYNLFDRAYDSSSATNTFRVSENGPLGRRLFTESRAQVRWSRTTRLSAIEAPAVTVIDAFTSGGAQQRGGQDSLDYEFATDLDYVHGAHSWRTGVLVEGGRYRSDDITNYLGTYTFANLADYNAGLPSSYSRRIGDPGITYSAVQAGFYVQDDYRVARSLLISSGLRYGVQSHVSDRWNLSPRMTVAWSPLRNGKLTLRANYGYFYDWIADDLYKETLLVDGSRLRELNLIDPSYPDPGAGGTTLPTNRYLWSDDLALPTAHRFNVGVDRVLASDARLSVTYARGWGRNLLRGRNLNAPAGGLRPDAGFANVIALMADAASRSQVVNVGFNFVRLERKRLFFVINYTWSKNDTNTTGGFTVPASGDNLASEWGPSPSDVRHRVGSSFSLSPFRNFNIGLNVRGQSGMPYNVTTGRDENGDGIFNDRPAGVSRNSVRGAAQWDVGGRLSYAWGFGTRSQRGGGAGGMRVVIDGGGGGLAPAFGGGADDKRYRLEVYLAGQNLLNRTNDTAYSFVMTSPFFGQPVAAAQPRKLQVGLRFGF